MVTGKSSRFNYTNFNKSLGDQRSWIGKKTESARSTLWVDQMNEKVTAPGNWPTGESVGQPATEIEGDALHFIHQNHKKYNLQWFAFLFY